jgi:cyclopropane fatty-acyl-phospholipid synthase-like methyltransferase
MIPVLNLGDQFLTGIFPKTKGVQITRGPLELLRCTECGLIQLSKSYDLNEMYGENYGYRSGLNSSMMDHLQNKVIELENLIRLDKDNIVLDIGSNDGTLLSFYRNKGLRRVGIDPTIIKFTNYYEKEIYQVPKFFNSENFKEIFGQEKAKIITSISMFYDLEDPAEFVKDIVKILDVEGIWHLEQSYMPSMLENNSYDTVCHEHLEYYSLTVLKNLFENNGLEIIDVSLNSINGGSFAVTAAHRNSKLRRNNIEIERLLEQERKMKLSTLKPYHDFEERVNKHRNDLISLIKGLKENGERVVGYGASTKGNVLLQFCDFTEKDLDCIAEINSDKFGSFTPGSYIPILPEEEVKATNPDYMLVLPWHFRDSIIKREKEYLSKGGRLIFPLPEIEII